MKKDNDQQLFNQTYGPFLQALAEWHAAFVEQVRITWEALVPVLQEMYDAIHTAYADAGTPYGDTQEGLSRWVKERGGNRPLMDGS